MSEERGTRSHKIARLVWGGIAGVLAAALVVSVSLSGDAVDGAEIDAEARAVDWTSTVLSSGTEPAELAAPILGSEFGELLLAVQSGILADERAVRVRLWNSEGALVFSSDQRDKVGGSQGTDSPEIETALDGETVSVAAQPLAAPRAGLAGANEELFQTFVPVPVGGEVAAGVAQIDQRYGMIESEGQEPWRIAQVILGVLVLGSLVMLVRPQRRELMVPSPPLGELAQEEATPPSRREARAAKRAAEKAEAEVREALERAERAEAAVEQSETAVAETERRLAELEERLAEAQERAAAAESAAGTATQPTGGSGHRGVPRVGALVAASTTGSVVAEAQERLHENELEHQRLSGEVDRLRAELGERDAELARVRAGSGAVGDGNGDVRASLAEEQTRAASAELRVADLEEQLRELREAASLAEAAASAAPQPRGVGDPDPAEEARAKLAETESALERALAELADAEEARAKLAETESALERALAELADAQGSTALPDAASVAPAGEVSDLQARIEQLEADRRTDVAELQRAQEALANTQFEATAARNRVKELEQQLRGAADEAASPEDAEEEGGSVADRSRNETEAPAEQLPADPYDSEPSVEEPARVEPLQADPPAAEEPPSQEGGSLRERLAQAAAARHRSARMTPPGES
jgi:predicted  nucleic acid-binding Zn-ribbon protein